MTTCAMMVDERQGLSEGVCALLCTVHEAKELGMERCFIPHLMCNTSALP